jgi:putative intracellular protease/amidase
MEGIGTGRAEGEGDNGGAVLGNIAYVFVFDGFADWEPALALCEVRKQERFKVKSVGLTKAQVTSMGGLRVLPDVGIDEVRPESSCIFILPGGDMWEKQTPPPVAGLLPDLRKAGVPIAAICGGTLAPARVGLLDDVKHTSNLAGYLKALVPEYRGEALYQDSLAVTDGDIVTASGAGFGAFAREILAALGVYAGAELEAWFNLFKHGIIPEGIGE